MAPNTHSYEDTLFVLVLRIGLFDSYLGMVYRVDYVRLPRLLGRLIYLSLRSIYYMLSLLTKQVKLKDDTCEELLKLGKMGQTYDDVVKMLLKFYKENKAKK